MDKLNAWNWSAVEANLRAKTGNACGGDRHRLRNPNSGRCVTIGLSAYKKMQAELRAQHALDMHQKARSNAHAMKTKYDMLDLNTGRTVQQLQQQLVETKRRANALAAAAATPAPAPAPAPIPVHIAAAIPQAHLDELVAARANRDRARAELQALQRRLDNTPQRENALRAELEAASQRVVNNLKETTSALQRDIQRLTSNLGASDAAAAALGKNVMNLQAQKSALQAQLRAATSDAAAFDIFQARLQNADATIDALERELQRAKNAAAASSSNVSSARAALELERRNAEARLRNAQQAKNALAALQQAKNASDAAAAAALANKNALEARMRNAAARNAATTAALQQAKNASNAAAAAALANRNALEAKLGASDAAADALGSHVAALQAQKNALQAQLRKASVDVEAFGLQKQAFEAQLRDADAIVAELERERNTSTAELQHAKNAAASLRAAKNASNAAKTALEAELRTALANKAAALANKAAALANKAAAQTNTAAALKNKAALEAAAAAAAELRQRLEREILAKTTAANTLQSQLQIERERLKTLKAEMNAKSKNASNKLMTNVADAGAALYELCVAKARYLKRRKREAEMAEAETRQNAAAFAQKRAEYARTPEGVDVPWWAILMYNPNRDGPPGGNEWAKTVNNLADKSRAIVVKTSKVHDRDGGERPVNAHMTIKDVLNAIKIAKAEAATATALPMYSADIPVMNLSTNVLKTHKVLLARANAANARARAAENALGKAGNQRASMLLFRAQAAEEAMERMVREHEQQRTAYQQEAMRYAQGAAQYAQVAEAARAELTKAQAELVQAQTRIPMNYENALAQNKNRLQKEVAAKSQNIAALQKRVQNAETKRAANIAALEQRVENAKRAAETTWAEDIAALQNRARNAENHRNIHQRRAAAAEKAHRQVQQTADAVQRERNALAAQLANLRADMNMHMAAGNAAIDDTHENIAVLKAQLEALEAQRRLATEQKAAFENQSLRDRAHAQTMADEATRLRLEFASKVANYEGAAEGLRKKILEYRKKLRERPLPPILGKRPANANANAATEPPQKQRPVEWDQQMMQPARVQQEQELRRRRRPAVVTLPSGRPQRTKKSTQRNNFVYYGNAKADFYSSRPSR